MPLKGSHDSRLTIYEGATQSDLASMFRMTPKTVKARLAEAGLRPKGTRGGYEIYEIKEAAPLLVQPPADIVDRVLRMHPNDMPKMLAKEYWMSRNHMLTVKQREGDLFTTRSVIDLAGDAFKTLRLSLMLFSDAVEREVGLTEEQRAIIERLVESALNDMRERLVDAISNRREHTRSKSFTSGEDDGAEDL